MSDNNVHEVGRKAGSRGQHRGTITFDLSTVKLTSKNENLSLRAPL